MKKYSDDELLVKNITANVARQWSEVEFFDFYDPSQQKLISSALDKMGVDYSFFGGYRDAERNILAVGAVGAKAFPIEVLKFPLPDEATHRDMLGAFLATGIKREVLGDILTDSDSGMVFVKDSFSMYLKDNVGKIKNKYPEIEIISYQSVAIPERRFEKKTCIVSSLRLDNIVGKICSLSRGDSAMMVKKGMVKVDHVVVEKTSYELTPGAIISIRGHGRFLFDEISGSTKKGNQKIEILKFM